MEIYETQELNPTQALAFEDEFNKQVGTFTERTSVGAFKCTITCFELEGDEVSICRKIENSL